MLEAFLRLDFLRVAIEVDFTVDVVLVEEEIGTAVVDHPGEGEVGESLVGITAADVSVYTREPALLEVDGCGMRKGSVSQFLYDEKA